MPLLAFLKKLRCGTAKTRQSPYIPDPLIDCEAAAYTNHAADITGERAASAKKLRASSPDRFSRAQAPVVSLHPSGRRMLSSTLNPNVSSFMRKSTRKSAKRSSRRLFRSRRIVAAAPDSTIVETDLSLLPSLLSESTAANDSTVTLHGSITSKVLGSLLTSVGKLKKIVFDEAIIKASPSSFSNLISSLGVESLSFFGCKFDNAQLICDQFFVENGQIVELTVCSKDGSMQSFPLLTDRTLERWATVGRQPPCIQLNNVATSFTVTGVEKLIRAFLSTASPYDRFCCKLGRLNTPMGTVVARLDRIKALKVHCVHHSFLVALSHNPRIELTLQTPLPLSCQGPSAEDATLDELPVLRRAHALRRRVAPMVNVSLALARSSSTCAPESVMVTKPGALSRARRTTMEKRKRRSMRTAKGQNVISSPLIFL